MLVVRYLLKFCGNTSTYAIKLENFGIMLQNTTKNDMRICKCFVDQSCFFLYVSLLCKEEGFVHILFKLI